MLSWQLFSLTDACKRANRGDCDTQKSGLVRVVAMVSTEPSWYACKKESADGNLWVMYHVTTMSLETKQNKILQQQFKDKILCTTGWRLFGGKVLYFNSFVVLFLLCIVVPILHGVQRKIISFWYISLNMYFLQWTQSIDLVLKMTFIIYSVNDTSHDILQSARGIV